MTTPIRLSRRIRFIRLVGAAQAVVLLASIVTAAAYYHRALHPSDHLDPTVDRQYTAIGWLVCAVVATACLVVLLVGVRRLRLGVGRGRDATIVAQLWTLALLVIAGNAVTGSSGPGDQPHPLSAAYPFVLLIDVLAVAAVLIALRVERKRTAAGAYGVLSGPDGRAIRR